MRRLVGTLVLLTALAAAPAWGQDAGDLAAKGLAAYRALEYQSAATLLRQSLAVGGPAALVDSARADILIYLGAAELFGGRRDAAAAAFREALETSPKSRPNALIFPPAVTEAFDGVRRTSNYVAVAAPPAFRIDAGHPYRLRVYTSAPLDVTVTLAAADGADEGREIYTGAVGDSAVVAWDGRAAGGAPARGRFDLRIRARSRMAADRVVTVPITASAALADTLPLPTPLPASAFFPERRDQGPAIAFLVGGLATGLLAAVVPNAVSSGTSLGPAPYAAGATLSLAGVIGFITRQPGRAAAAHLAANQALRTSWQREHDAALAANAERRRSVSIDVVAGPPTGGR